MHIVDIILVDERQVERRDRVSRWDWKNERGKFSPCPERRSNAVTMHCNRCRVKLRSLGAGSTASSPSLVSNEVKSFSACKRSRKKSILTKCANFAMPVRAAGRSGLGRVFFNTRKYRANRSFSVSVCCRWRSAGVYLEQ